MRYAPGLSTVVVEPRYGIARQHGTGDTSYQQGLNYLQDARKAFQECNAAFDLQMVERILARHPEPALTSARKSSSHTR